MINANELPERISIALAKEFGKVRVYDVTLEINSMTGTSIKLEFKILEEHQFEDAEIVEDNPSLAHTRYLPCLTTL